MLMKLHAREARQAPPDPPRSRVHQVVAAEEGCMLYQLVKNKDGEYFVLEVIPQAIRKLHVFWVCLSRSHTQSASCLWSYEWVF